MATKKNCSSILFDLILYDALLLTDLSFQITQFNWNFNDERVRVCVLVYFELLLQFNWKWDNQSNVHMNGNVADAWQWHSEISCVDDNLVVYDCDHSRIGVYADMGIEMFDSLRSGLEHLTRFCTCCEAICAPIVRWSVYVRVHSINVQCCLCVYIFAVYMVPVLFVTYRWSNWMIGCIGEYDEHTRTSSKGNRWTWTCLSIVFFPILYDLTFFI